MSDMPDLVWIGANETLGKSPPECWPNGWPAVFKQKRDRSTKYIRADIHETLKAEHDKLQKTYFDLINRFDDYEEKSKAERDAYKKENDELRERRFDLEFLNQSKFERIFKLEEALEWLVICIQNERSDCVNEGLVKAREALKKGEQDGY